MSHNALPTAADVTTMLSALPQPITLPGSFDVQSEIDSAVQDWDDRTGYRPFFQTSGTGITRYFDPPGPDRRGSSRGSFGELSLHNGLISLTSLSVGVVTADSNAGTLLTLGKDFWLSPGNAQADPGRKRPYTHIEFSYPQRGLPQSIAIVGVWGYCNAANTIPANAWAAIRDMAAARCLETLTLYITQGPTMSHEDDVTEQYDTRIISDIITFLGRRAERVLSRYRLFA